MYLMLRTLLIIPRRKMNSERKIRDKLAKNLSAKRIPKKVTSKIEQAEGTSQFFKEIQNKDKAKIKSENHLNQLKLNEQKTATKNSQILKAYKNYSTAKEPAFKCISQDAEAINEMKPSLEVEITKSLQSSKSRKKNKAQAITSEEPSTSKKIKQELSDKQWQPPNYEDMLDNIRKMRSNDKAPVDTMGCHKCADENADEKTQRFHKLVALMLSSQTKDDTTYNAMLRLRENNLTPEAICDMKASVLENIIHPVSFYKNKAKYIQQTSKILIEKYNSDIPNNIKELVALPGVGPKMAHICMATAWNEITGIGVDVHVHRISNRIGWLPKPTKEPEQTRIALESWLPKHLWREVNHLLVGFGQTICTPVKPKCADCTNFKMCPSAVKTIKKEIVK